RKLVAARPGVSEFRSALAGALTNMGLLLNQTGQRTEALAAYQEARELQEFLVKVRSDVSAYQDGLATTLTNMGNVLATIAIRRAEALLFYRQALKLREKLVKEHPDVTTYQADLARVAFSRGMLLLNDNKPAAAVTDFGTAITTSRAVLKSDPRSAD